MKVILLAGGLGTRISEETANRPKPMVEIGGKPILWHIMGLYAGYGFQDFVVACGYKSEVIKGYFHNLRAHLCDSVVNLSDGTCTFIASRLPDWRVALIDTGLHTKTGGRIKRLQAWTDGGAFMATYGDGLGDVDIERLVAFHKRHGKLATVTAVRPPARFGGLNLDSDRVVKFTEKPQAGDGWINGGFFVFEPGVFDYIAGDETSLEVEPLEALAADGQLMAYRHDGFWQPMDTLREKQLLESIWQAGNAPWTRAVTANVHSRAA
jgi:glucose-1-phosphate cytidylyltransferase